MLVECVRGSVVARADGKRGSKMGEGKRGRRRGREVNWGDGGRKRELAFSPYNKSCQGEQCAWRMVCVQGGTEPCKSANRPGRGQERERERV